MKSFAIAALILLASTSHPKAHETYCTVNFYKVQLCGDWKVTGRSRTDYLARTRALGTENVSYEKHIEFSIAGYSSGPLIRLIYPKKIWEQLPDDVVMTFEFDQQRELDFTMTREPLPSSGAAHGYFTLRDSEATKLVEQMTQGKILIIRTLGQNGKQFEWWYSLNGFNEMRKSTEALSDP